VIRTTVALALVLLTSACNATRPRRGEEGAPKAVVLAAPDGKERAETIARALNTSLGYDVLLKVTTIRRARSSVAVYGLKDAPERLEEIVALLRDLGIDTGTGPGSTEVLPFPQHATGGNAVVVGLGADAAPAAPGDTSQSFDASSPATSR
jgi:hypothetical protein